MISTPPGARRFVAPLAAALLSTVVALPGTANASPATARAYQHADRAVVAAATGVVRCESSKAGSHCTSERSQLRSAGRRLSAAQLHLPTATAASITRRRKNQQAPVVSIAGQTLRWQAVAGAPSYLVVRRVNGREDLYTVVTGTTTTPAAVPGKIARFSVRTAVVGSAWARQAKMASAAAADPKAPPALSVAGQTVRWSSVNEVSGYSVVTKAPGVADRYVKVRGTSLTPPATPGATVRVSVRTDVAGSRWAPERTITYPADASADTAPSTDTASNTDTAPNTVTAPSTVDSAPAAPVRPATGTPLPSVDQASATATAPAPADGSFQFGINSGSALQWELGFIKPLAAKHVRAEFEIGTTVAQMTPIIAAYAEAGIQPLLLAGFNARLPTDAEMANVATWAAAFGTGGTFWAGKSYPASVQVTNIEFGNEVNNPWQYTGVIGADNWQVDPTFLQRAKDYARDVRTASLAIKAANPRVGLLAVGDEYSGYTTWVDAMFSAVPDLGRYVDGWTIHPYGPHWSLTMDAMLAATRAHGAPDLPMYATEWGLSSDDGRCLTDNFGWDKCMNYANAASALHGAVAGMRAKYGSRLAAVYLYSNRDLRASSASDDREHFFGATRSDGTAKGAYTTEVRAQLAASA